MKSLLSNNNTRWKIKEFEQAPVMILLADEAMLVLQVVEVSTLD
jgi:hypothetical protein